MIQYAGKVVPIEVKAEENLQAKSLKAFYKRYAPDTCIRTSMSDFRQDEWLVNILLYAIGTLLVFDCIKKGCLITRQPFLFITNPDFVSGWG